MEAGREFQLLEVIGTNVLANEVVRHFSNLTANWCWDSAKRVLRAKHALGGIIDFNSSEHLIEIKETELIMRVENLLKRIYTYISYLRNVKLNNNIDGKNILRF